jgi:hypothetical protein
MTRIEEAEQQIKVAAFELGVPELAKRAGLNENTVRKLLKAPPAAVGNLKKLESVAQRHADEKAATAA